MVCGIMGYFIAQNTSTVLHQLLLGVNLCNLYGKDPCIVVELMFLLLPRGLWSQVLTCEDLLIVELAQPYVTFLYLIFPCLTLNSKSSARF